MPPLETYSPPPDMGRPPNMGPPPNFPVQKPITPLIISAALIALSLILFFISQKFPKYENLKWISPILIIIAIALGASFFTMGGPNNSNNQGLGPAPTPVPAPLNVEEKIQGYWGTRLFLITQSLETDILKMKAVGINTITMAPQLEHKGDGDITEQQGTQRELQQAINKAHLAGFRVMIDPAPMTTEFNPKTENPDLFIKNMTKITLKYAQLAEEYNVEYFSPLTEPVAQLGSVKADQFMHDILPKIKKRFSGKVVFKKQSNDLEEFKNIDQNHITEIEFMLTGHHFGVGFKNTLTNSLSLDIREDMIALERRQNQRGTQIDKKELTVEKNQWHTLRIKQKGKKVIVLLNGDKLFEYQGNQKAHGNYNLASGGVRVRKFTLTNLKGKSLISDKKIGDNWSGQEGWTIEDWELVGHQASNPAKSAGQLNLIHDIDFTGYDMIALHLWKEGTVQSLSDYRQEVRYKIGKTRQQADSDGVPEILVGEFGGTTLQEVEWGTNRIKTEAGQPMTNWELADVAQMVMEEAENTTSGYLYNGWNIQGQGIHQIPEVERVIKAWFTTH